MIMTPRLCRAARAALDWTQYDLAARAAISPDTITKFEAGKRKPSVYTLRLLKQALESGGVKFLSDRRLVLPPESLGQPT